MLIAVAANGGSAGLRPSRDDAASLAVRNLPKMGEQLSEEFTWDNRDYFPEMLSRVNVLRHPFIDETLSGGEVPLRRCRFGTNT